MSFPQNPKLWDQFTLDGVVHYWCGTSWVKPGEVRNTFTHYDVVDPTPANSGHLSFGCNWVNVTTKNSFEFISPGSWRPLVPEPSIQLSTNEPKTQSCGYPLVDGDIWVNPVKLTINIYSKTNAAWYDILASITTGTPTKGGIKI
jgi:hypothetical protein